MQHEVDVFDCRYEWDENESATDNIKRACNRDCLCLKTPDVKTLDIQKKKIGICPVLLIRSNSAIIYRQQNSRGDRCEQPPEVRFA